ncbi:MAG: S-layer homology domain-containing protein [Armatimonadetes bacterium]|nr:S-layer homology domain-containing protein [Armatimonadota bacterium]
MSNAVPRRSAIEFFLLLSSSLGIADRWGRRPDVRGAGSCVLEGMKMKRLCLAGIACFVLLSALAAPLHAHPPVYAGTSSPGIVYEYKGGTVWEAISPVLGEAVLSLVEFEGKLHAGTTSVDYDGYTIVGRVYRYDGDGQWAVVGNELDQCVRTMAVYNNLLYAGTTSGRGDVYRYEGDLRWRLVVDYWYDWVCWVDSTAMWVGDDGYLYLAFDVDPYETAEIAFGSIMGYDGSKVSELAKFPARRIYDFSQQGTDFFAASYGCDDSKLCERLVARLHRSSDGRYWSTVLEYYDWDLWAIEQFEGYLYLGYDDGLLARTDGSGSFESVWQAPNSIISMAADGHDALYFGTGAGKVYALDGVSDPAPISTVLGGGIECLYHPRTFPDIRPEHWAFEEIEGCCAGGVVGGYADGAYHPRAAVTRDQMAVFIVRALVGGEENVPEPTGAPTFPDVPADYWAYDHIEYAYAAGVVQGYTTGLYEPTVALTRDQMAVFIARALCGGQDGVPDLPCSTAPFTDVPCTYWARTHIQYILVEGVTQGYPDGGYHPKQVCTRAEMAVFMSRAFHLSM